jgi:hypothetical protein
MNITVIDPSSIRLARFGQMGLACDQLPGSEQQLNINLEPWCLCYSLLACNVERPRSSSIKHGNWSKVAIAKNNLISLRETVR